VGGLFSPGTFSGSGGTVSSSTASYSEVGAINLQLQDATFASVDAADGSSAAELTVYSPVVTVGRFVPDHFAVSAGAVTVGCAAPGKTAFTYLGQDALGTQQSLVAQNALNATTQNYTGTLASLDLTSYASYGFGATGLPTGSTLGSGAVAPTGIWVAGVALNTMAHHLFSKPATAVVPASISLLSTPVDTDGVSVASAATLATNQVLRYGRLKLGNTYGATSTDAVLPLAAQYWAVSSFVANPDDGCTTVASTALGFKNYTADLSSAELGASHLVGSSWTLASGAASLRLSKPSAGDGKYRGSVDVFVNLGTDAACTTTGSTALPLAYLQDAWVWGAASCANPVGRVTLGVEKQKWIYRREMY